MVSYWVFQFTEYLDPEMPNIAQWCILFNFCPACHTAGPVHLRSSPVLKDIDLQGPLAHYSAVWWRHPIKIWVDFTGYLSNHFWGCRLNGQLCSKLTWPDKKYTKCSTVHCGKIGKWFEPWWTSILKTQNWTYFDEKFSIIFPYLVCRKWVSVTL